MKTLPAFTEDQTCLETLTSCINSINKNKTLNTFCRVYEDHATQTAKDIDARVAKGTHKKLAKMIVSLKDLFCYKDHPIQASSKILEGFISQINATAVQKLIDNDAVIIGHNGCDEFGMGSSNENSCYGPVLNPVDHTRVPGGSSGGSAAAVKAHQCHISLGTDTGGSVRQPAALCGIVGFKPTYSRISRYGVIAYASSFDTVGILSQNIYDCAVALEVLSGHDDKDTTSSRQEVDKYSEDMDYKGSAKVAYFDFIMQHEGLDQDIKDSIRSVVRALKGDTHQVSNVEFPLLEHCLPIYYILTTAEASANLARYDGVKYGKRSPNYTDMESMLTNTRTEGFGQEAKKRILLGTAVLSAGYYESYYGKAQKLRSMIKGNFTKIFETYEFVILPTTPTTAFKLNAFSDPLSMLLSDLYTVPASIAGLPAISIPIGEDRGGLPIGLQILAAPFNEKKLLSFAQRITDIIRQDKAKTQT